MTCDNLGQLGRPYSFPAQEVVTNAMHNESKRHTGISLALAFRTTDSPSDIVAVKLQWQVQFEVKQCTLGNTFVSHLSQSTHSSGIHFSPTSVVCKELCPSKVASQRLKFMFGTNKPIVSNCNYIIPWSYWHLWGFNGDRKCLNSIKLTVAAVNITLDFKSIVCSLAFDR